MAESPNSVNVYWTPVESIRTCTSARRPPARTHRTMLLAADAVAGDFGCRSVNSVPLICIFVLTQVSFPSVIKRNGRGFFTWGWERGGKRKGHTRNTISRPTLNTTAVESLLMSWSIKGMTMCCENDFDVNSDHLEDHRYSPCYTSKPIHNLLYLNLQWL